MPVAELAPELRLQQPYPGLRPFEQEEAFLFYGREMHTAELLRRLAENRFLAVVGNSGSGKSSLVRAGLLPSLHRGLLIGATSQWRICVMRPGSAPLDSLAEALIEQKVLSGDRKAIREDLGRSSLGLVQVVREAKFAEGVSLLLVVDQFEELFRFARERKEEDEGAEVRLFVSSLLEAADRSTAPIYVVLTMRSDYIGDCTRFSGLPELLNRSQYLIPRLTREQIRDAIEKPVRCAGAQMSPLLVERLLNEHSEHSEQNEQTFELPVLQHALNRTFHEWKKVGAKGEVSVDHYVTAGTVRAALDLHANELLAENLVDENWAERLFRCLTTVEGGRSVRRPTRLERVYEVIGAQNERSRHLVLEVIRTYSRRDDSLLVWSGKTLSEDSVIDISHESLIVLWQVLAQWVEAESRAAEWYQSVCIDVVRDRTGEAGKWRDRQLATAHNYLRQGYWNEAWAARLPNWGAKFSEVEEFLDRNAAEQLREQQQEEERQARELNAERNAKEEAEAREKAERKAKQEAEAREKAEHLRAEEQAVAAARAHADAKLLSKRLRLLQVATAIIIVAAVAAWYAMHRANALAREIKRRDEYQQKILNKQAAEQNAETDQLIQAAAQAQKSGDAARAKVLQAEAEASRLKAEANQAAADSRDARAALARALSELASAKTEVNQLRSDRGAAQSPPENSGALQAALNRATKAEKERDQLRTQLWNEMGDNYFYGKNGVSKDYSQALSWYRKAAEAGNAQGMGNLGRLYARGLGGPAGLQPSSRLVSQSS